jgi:hypothetical protein
VSFLGLLKEGRLSGWEWCLPRPAFKRCRLLAIHTSFLQGSYSVNPWIKVGASALMSA